MITLKQEFPFVLNGEIKENLIRHYAEDEDGVQYKIKQVETGIIYDEAVDIVPCRYTYEPTEELAIVLEEPEEIEQVFDENKGE